MTTSDGLSLLQSAQQKQIPLTVSSPERQEGTAVLMALLFVAIVMTLSMSWFSKTQISIRRTAQMIAADQARLYADGVLAWGMTALSKDPSCPKNMPQDILMPVNVLISGRIDEYAATLRIHPDMISQKYVIASPFSGYYLLRADVDTTGHHLILYSLLHRKTADGMTRVMVVWQRRGLY